MSLFRPANIVCPSCGELITMQAVGSVNADRRPDYRDAILNDSFQDIQCGSCGAEFRLQPRFNYLDVGRSQWIAAFPAVEMPNYLEIEDDVAEIWAASYGDASPPAAQDIGQSLDVRITFGWPAVREKLLARQAGLDDVALETLKLDMLRGLKQATLAAGIEMRLVDVNTTTEELWFVWLESASERALQEISVAQSAYQAIAENAEPWQAIQARLTSSAFVDIKKLYIGEGRDAA